MGMLKKMRASIGQTPSDFGRENICEYKQLVMMVGFDQWQRVADFGHS